MTLETLVFFVVAVRLVLWLLSLKSRHMKHQAIGNGLAKGKQPPGFQMPMAVVFGVSGLFPPRSSEDVPTIRKVLQ